ncbi:MAG TPA: Hpt domain-containing protein [Mucilaginibacter sp.]
MKENKNTDEILPANLNLYDLTDIKLLTNNDDMLFVKLLNILIEMFSSETKNIRSLAKDNDWKAIAEIVHKLKTSLIHIQVNSLKQVVRDLEDYEDQNNEKLNLLKDEFCNALDNIVIYLKVDLSAFTDV